MNDIVQNLKDVRKNIQKHCKAAGRDVDSVRLVAVSKKQPMEKLHAALDAGHRLFGENRVQEAEAHWLDLKAQYPDMKLHLIGPLQSNKAAQAVSLFDCIETVDRKKIVNVLAAEMEKQGRQVPCFIQVNTGEEPQKSGVIPEKLPELLVYAREKGLSVTGLMCIPPFEEPPALHFALLQKLAAENDLEHLSMGMSTDYERAIPLGATYVRVGTGIFGEREG